MGDREGRRAELLKAATAVIAEEGFAGASLRRVADRAGFTTGAVSYYFENKEAMMVAVIESRFDVFDELLASGGDQHDIRAGLESFLALTQLDEGETIAGFSLLAHARHEPALAAVYQRRYGRYRDAFAAVLAKAQRQGLVRDDISPDILADQLSAMADGWMLLIPVEVERFRPKRLKALIEATMELIAPLPSAKGRSASTGATKGKSAEAGRRSSSGSRAKRS